MQDNYTTFIPHLEEVENIFSEFISGRYHIRCQRLDKRPECCKRKMNIKDYRSVKIKDLCYGNKPVIIEIRKQRYVCPKCKKTVTASLKLVEKGCTISNRVKSEIIRKLGEMKALKQIALEEKVSSSTVFRELDNLKIDRTGERDTTVIFLDEFKGNAGNGKYQLAVYDRNHKLVEVLEDRNASTIKNFLISLEVKPERVVTDMFKPFRPAIRSVLPEVEIIVDKYHVIRQADWMLRDIRRNLFSSDNSKYRDYKKYWKLIAKNPVKDFSQKQLYRIEQLKSLNERFSLAYDLRRSFYGLFKLDSVDIFENKLLELIEKLRESGIKECMYLGETLGNWKNEISNIIKYGINNGFVEGYNNKIKVIKRVSYGIRRYERLRKLIHLRTA